MLLNFLILSTLVVVTNGAVSSHIIGGGKADYGDHPYICSLQQNSFWGWGHICGAVIWNNNYVVTAAHCVGSSTSSIRVVCGLHHLNKEDSHQVTHGVRAITKHPNYNKGKGTYPHDIALLKLTSPLEFNPLVKNYRFANDGDGDFAGQHCILSGWGYKENRQNPETLKKVSMLTISNSQCQTKWEELNGVIIPGHICFHEEGKSSCNGDSGGPVRCGDVITGITSWGISDCSSEWPSVYTRTSVYHAWLSQEAGPQPPSN